MAEKTEKNPKGAGRPQKDVHRVTVNISGTPDQIERLKELARESGKNTSQYILEKTGVIKMNKNKWFVANDDGAVIGHDMTEVKAKILAQEMQEKEPNEGWEALNGADED